MSFQACALVPCYNHGATVGDVVTRLRAQGLPVLVVDDGSDGATVRALDALTGVHLVRLERNHGKGGAVLRGLREAARLGYSHALQIDADGQHCVEDAPRFLEAGRACPAAVVCGAPEYDATAPKARRYGRLLTQFWVWVETLGRGRGDAMCGFRLYPLAPVLALAERVALAPRMAFDIDILVRLVREGVPVTAVRTRVVYPAGGLSHFRMLRDNLQISAVHTRLVLGMFVPPKGSRHWSRIGERGGFWGLRLIAATRALLGQHVARLVLLPAVAWFFVTGTEARRASRSYLERLADHAGPSMPSATLWNVWRHMVTFADASLDKLAAWRGEFDEAAFEFDGADEFERLVRARRGALFIGSHLGNLEVIRALASTRNLAAVTAVVYTDHARRFSAELARTNERFGDNLLEVSDFGPHTAILLRERIERGEILVIVGDRTPPAESGRRAHVPFLGHAAPFPQGPMVLAHLLGCPVYLFFCLKNGLRYRIHLEPFAECVQLPSASRTAAIDDYVSRYARRLEWYCGKAPLQWFNFFDFWHDPVGRG